MKSEHIYLQRQSAGRMEVVMLVASVIGIITAILAFFSYGWAPSVALLLLSLIAYALSRVFDFLSDLLGSTETDRQSPSATGKGPG